MFVPHRLFSGFFLLINTASLLSATIVLDPVRANPNTLIPANVAQRRTSDIFIAPGRLTVISFQDGETITQVEPSDNHRIIFNTNSPLSEGEATHLVITQVERFAHPEATINTIPNLIVFTTNADRSHHAVYEFNLHLDSSFNRGVTVTDIPVEQKITWNTKYGQAHPMDIQNGFEIAKREGKITESDAHQIRTFLALVRNGISIDDAIAQTQVNFDLIDILAETGLKHFHRRLFEGNYDIHQIRCDGDNCSPQNN